MEPEDSPLVGNCHVTVEAESLRDKAAREILCAMLANPEIVGLVGVGNQERYLLDDAKSRDGLCYRAYLIVQSLGKARDIPTEAK